MYKRYPKGLKLTPEKEHLVTENLGLAHKLAHKWYNGVVDFEDLRQQAYLILVDCAIKFDETNGNKFSTYCYKCISITLNNYVQSYNKLVKFPIGKIYKVYHYLSLPEGPEREQYRIEQKLTTEDIEIYKTYEIVYLDTQVCDDYETVNNLIQYSVEEQGYDSVNSSTMISQIVELLPTYIENQLYCDIYRDVILTNFDDYYFKDISKKYGISKKKLKSIIAECQEILRSHKNEIDN